MYCIVEDGLYHHGILGQKWGIRRFQPYPKGYTGNGKETGKAAKVKQRVTKAARMAVNNMQQQQQARDFINRSLNDITQASLHTTNLMNNQMMYMGKPSSKSIAKYTVDKVKAEKKVEKKAIKQEQRRIKAEKRTAKALEKFEKKKRKLITRGTPEQILKNAGDLTLNELNEAYSRLEAQRKIKSLIETPTQKQPSAPQQAVTKLSKKEEKKRTKENVDKFFKELKTINNYMGTGIETYKKVSQIKEIMDGKKPKDDEDDDKKR